MCIRDRAAPIAAFVATNGGGRTGPAPAAKRRAEAAAEDGGDRFFCLAMQMRARRPAEKNWAKPLLDWAACRSIALSEGRERRPLPQQWEALKATTMKVQRARQAPFPVPAQSPMSMKRATSRDTICSLSAARKAS